MPTSIKLAADSSPASSDAGAAAASASSAPSPAENNNDADDNSNSTTGNLPNPTAATTTTATTSSASGEEEEEDDEHRQPRKIINNGSDGENSEGENNDIDNKLDDGCVNAEEDDDTVETKKAGEGSKRRPPAAAAAAAAGSEDDDSNNNNDDDDDDDESNIREETVAAEKSESNDNAEPSSSSSILLIDAEDDPIILEAEDEGAAAANDEPSEEGEGDDEGIVVTAEKKSKMVVANDEITSSIGGADPPKDESPKEAVDEGKTAMEKSEANNDDDATESNTKEADPITEEEDNEMAVAVDDEPAVEGAAEEEIVTEKTRAANSNHRTASEIEESGGSPSREEDDGVDDDDDDDESIEGAGGEETATEEKSDADNDEAESNIIIEGVDPSKGEERPAFEDELVEKAGDEGIAAEGSEADNDETESKQQIEEADPSGEEAKRAVDDESIKGAGDDVEIAMEKSDADNDEAESKIDEADPWKGEDRMAVDETSVKEASGEEIATEKTEVDNDETESNMKKADPSKGENKGAVDEKSVKEAADEDIAIEKSEAENDKTKSKIEEADPMEGEEKMSVDVKSVKEAGDEDIAAEKTEVDNDETESNMKEADPSKGENNGAVDEKSVKEAADEDIATEKSEAENDETKSAVEEVDKPSKAKAESKPESTEHDTKEPATPSKDIDEFTANIIRRRGQLLPKTATSKVTDNENGEAAETASDTEKIIIDESSEEDEKKELALTAVIDQGLTRLGIQRKANGNTAQNSKDQEHEKKSDTSAESQTFEKMNVQSDEGDAAAIKKRKGDEPPAGAAVAKKPKCNTDENDSFVKLMLRLPPPPREIGLIFRDDEPPRVLPLLAEVRPDSPFRSIFPSHLIKNYWIIRVKHARTGAETKTTNCKILGAALEACRKEEGGATLVEFTFANRSTGMSSAAGVANDKGTAAAGKRTGLLAKAAAATKKGAPASSLPMKILFPNKLMTMLNKESNLHPDIVSWLPDGFAFVIKDRKEFEANSILAKYFATSWISFVRLLSRYGFLRKNLSNGHQYHHPLFNRDRPQWCQLMKPGARGKQQQQSGQPLVKELKKAAATLASRSSSNDGGGDSGSNGAVVQREAVRVEISEQENFVKLTLKVPPSPQPIGLIVRDDNQHFGLPVLMGFTAKSPFQSAIHPHLLQNYWIIRICDEDMGEAQITDGKLLGAALKARQKENEELVAIEFVFARRSLAHVPGVLPKLSPMLMAGGDSTALAVNGNGGTPNKLLQQIMIQYSTGMNRTHPAMVQSFQQQLIMQQIAQQQLQLQFQQRLIGLMEDSGGWRSKNNAERCDDAEDESDDEVQFIGTVAGDGERKGQELDRISRPPGAYLTIRSRTFSQRIDDLRAYKKKHGHTNVTSDEDAGLHKFFDRMRQERKNQKLSKERIAFMNELGFDWEYVDGGDRNRKECDVRTSGYRSFEERIDDLKAYKKEHGHMNVTSRQDDSLHKFCSRMRRERKNHKLTKVRICMMDNIGFNWEPEDGRGKGKLKAKYKSFPDRLADLEAFKGLFGHTDVTQDQDPELYHFCANARYARKHEKIWLTLDHIASLDALNFDWDDTASQLELNSC